MTGFCPICRQLLPVRMPVDAPLDGPDRNRLLCLLAGQAGFAHMMQFHSERAAALFERIATFQALIGAQFFGLASPDPEADEPISAAWDSARADLVAWLSSTLQFSPDLSGGVVHTMKGELTL